MSFAGGAACSFNLASILNNAPEQPGIYGLCNNREWIYISEAANIQASLLEQLNTTQSAVKLRNPTGFTFEVCPFASIPERKRSLLHKLKPCCNATETPREARRRTA